MAKIKNKPVFAIVRKPVCFLYSKRGRSALRGILAAVLTVRLVRGKQIHCGDTNNNIDDPSYYACHVTGEQVSHVPLEQTKHQPVKAADYY
jgi:hypothetical protein